MFRVSILEGKWRVWASTVNGNVHGVSAGNEHLQCKYLINLTLTLEEKDTSITVVNKNDTVCLPPNAKLFDSVKLMKMEDLENVKAVRAPLRA